MTDNEIIKTCGEMCGDNRFVLIEKFKQELLEHTNIKTAKDEVAVLNSLLFRFWQMGWLDKLEDYNRQKAEIERLRKGTSQTIESIRKLARDTIRDTKSEAIKEFAERVTEHIPHFDDGYTTMECVKGAVNYLVKEMTEVNNESAS